MLYKTLFLLLIASFCFHRLHAQDRVLRLNETVVIKVKAAQQYNKPGIKLMKEHSYEISAIGHWKDGSCDSTNADGFKASECGSPLPGVDILMSATEELKRDRNSNWLCLTGEIFDRESNVLDNIRADQQFSIGRTKKIKPQVSGKLVLYANDVMTGYDNNNGQLIVTIKRIG